MSKRKYFKKAIWAYDPFESNHETRSKVVSVLKKLHEKLNMSIQPVYVLSPGSVNLQMSFSPPLLRQYMPSIEKIMHCSLKEVSIEGLLDPEVVIQRTESLRSTVRAFLASAKAKHADLIVTGTHASRGLARFLLGSFTETLILHSKIPVLVVNPGAKTGPIRRILFPTDLTVPSKSFFKGVCALAKGLGAEVELFHVISHPIAPLFQSGIYLFGGGWLSLPDYMRGAEEQSRKTAEQWKEEGKKNGVTVSVFFDVGRGSIQQAIRQRVREEDIGMIAMGARSGAVGAALIGSVVRQVVREAPCPVWIVR